MANRNPPNQFKPGKSGNPDGRPSLPPDLKEARALNKVELERLLNKYIHMDLPGMKTIYQDTKTPAIEAIIAKIIFEAVSRGDEKRLDFILNRLIGPVKVILQIENVSDEEFEQEAERRMKLVSGS